MTKQRAIDRAVVKITTVAESIDIPPVQRGILAAALRDLIEASSAEPACTYGETMNLSMWETIREYVAAEVRLGIARHQRDVHDEAGTADEIAGLEEQSTRMETEVRRLLELEQKQTADAIRRASFGPPKLR